MAEGALPGWAAPQPWQAPAPAGYGAPVQAKKPGLPLWLGVTGMSVGLATMVVSFVLLIWPAVDTLLNSQPVPTPTTRLMHLDDGAHGVYERTARVDVFGPSIEPDDVVITDDDGATIPTRFHFGVVETLDIDAGSYTAVIDFDVPESGDYTITIDSAEPSEVVIAPLLENQFELGWLGVTAIGGLVFVLGGVLLIVGMVRRGRAKRRAQPPWPQQQWPQAPSYPQF